MNINDLSTQLLYTTVPIYAKKDEGSLSSGTGFMFQVWENDTGFEFMEKIYEENNSTCILLYADIIISRL